MKATRNTVYGVVLTIAIGASLSWVPSSPAPAQAQDCDVRDGTASRGEKVGSRPTRYKYERSPYLGVRFSSCKGNVRVYFGFGGTVRDSGTRYRINYGQRENSTKPVFSHTRETGVLREGQRQSLVDSFDTREREVDVFAFFRVQQCFQRESFERSSCTRWSPTVTVSLGRNELTDY